MKRLYLIGGTMGIGKTSVCRALKAKLENAVFLDGDWCWDADPFQVTDETKRMVVDNICHLLNNFVHCPAYENVVFCWVMHEQSIIDEILARLDLAHCEVKLVSLVCRSDILAARLRGDIEAGIRREDVLARSLERLPLYDVLDTRKVDTSDRSIDEIADWIAGM